MAYSKKSESGSYEDLRKALKSGSLGSLYLFYGEEDYLREAMLREMKKQLVGETADMNYMALDGKDCTPQVVYDAVESFPVFAEHRLVVVRDYDILRPEEKYRGAWQEILQNLPDYAHVVFVYDTVDFTGAGKSGKVKPPNKDMEKIFKEKNAFVHFEVADEQSLVNWIQRHFASLGKQCSASDAHFLIFYCGRQMSSLHGEIAKIAAYSKKEKVLREDIERVGSRVPDAVIYDLTGAVAEGKTGNACRLVSELLSMKTDGLTMVGGIARNVRQIYAARLAQEQGMSEFDYAKRFGISQYPAKLSYKAARGKDIRTLRTWMSLCADADYALKSERGDTIWVELLITKMAVAG